MIDFFIQKLIPDHQNTKNPKVRSAYGTLSSIFGLCCNLLLFLLKYVLGTLSHSIAIISDAFNNLSDAANCTVTLFAYKPAAKPADKDHPFGHGRMEYLTSLLIAVLIILVGFELLRDSFRQLLHPQEILFHPVVFLALLLSILVKLGMAHFNFRLGHRIASSVLLATAQDSRNDVLATAATCIGFLASPFTDLPIDGAVGLLVSLFILKNGIDIIRNTLDDLLGRPTDPELAARIKDLICSNERILGIHDLVIHNYGPGHIIGSCHAEVNSTEPLLSIHDLIDKIERDIYENLHIRMTIHLDPVETENEQANQCKALLLSIIQGIDPALSIHDFRMIPGETCTTLFFDLLVPYDCSIPHAQICSEINMALAKEAACYRTAITVDQSYISS